MTGQHLYPIRQPFRPDFGHMTPEYVPLGLLMGPMQCLKGSEKPGAGSCLVAFVWVSDGFGGVPNSFNRAVEDRQGQAFFREVHVLFTGGNALSGVRSDLKEGVEGLGGARNCYLGRHPFDLRFPEST